MKKLFIVGCSFSDNLPKNQVYGNLLAKKLGYEYVHMAIGIGSNYRMWRYATNAIMNKELTSNDLLIVQYTGTERCEFWSDIEKIKPDVHTDFSETYDKGGTILKFKWDAHVWQQDKSQIEFFKTYQERFLNPAFEEEKFKFNNFNFQSMLAYNKIKTVFFHNRANKFFDVLEHFQPYAYREPDELHQTASYLVDGAGGFHMNELGHSIVADLLFNHINACKVMDS